MSAVINELAPPISIDSMIRSVLSEPRTPQQAKATAITALLGNIEAVNLFFQQSHN